MWKFVISASNKENWYQENKQEVCFIGRSNVGKSSLINALANQKIARTSNTPGRTQLINYFVNEKNHFIVDLPGYGYAKMSKTNNQKMLNMLEQYFLERKQLITVFLLFDSKVGLTSLDQDMIQYLDSINRKVILVGTKLDKTNQSERSKIEKEVLKFNKQVIFTSSSKTKNIQKLLLLINEQFDV